MFGHSVNRLVRSEPAGCGVGNYDTGERRCSGRQNGWGGGVVLYHSGTGQLSRGDVNVYLGNPDLSFNVHAFHSSPTNNIKSGSSRHKKRRVHKGLSF